MNPINQKTIDELSVELSRKLGIIGEDPIQVLKDDLKDAVIDALDYCNRDILVDNMSSAVKDLYLFRRNTEGVEGETSRSEGGISQSFEVGIPKRIQAKLNRYRVAKVRSL